jgi:hypothetical protein
MQWKIYALSAPPGPSSDPKPMVGPASNAQPTRNTAPPWKPTFEMKLEFLIVTLSKKSRARPPPVVAEALFAANLRISKTSFGYGRLAHDLVCCCVCDELYLQAGRQVGRN